MSLLGSADLNKIWEIEWKTISSSFDPNLLMEKTLTVSSAGFAPDENPFKTRG